MAKMFYTIEEVCEKLDKSEAEVREMASSGQLQEFRDRDKLMFKVEQIDLLTHGDDESGDLTIDLDATGGASAVGLSASGLDLADDSVVGLSDSREETGISVFDTSHGSAAPIGDAIGGDTQVGVDAIEEELSLEAVGSGSGLLDLTRESDDTSLGAELLEEVYASDENIEIPANASGLFEAAGTESPGEQLVGGPIGAASIMPVMVESYDGLWSGLGGGLMVGTMVALVFGIIVAIVGVDGTVPDIALMFAGNLWVWLGGLAGGVLLFAIIGAFLGKASD
ncbi:MAG: helix-turn-helix domain-containing protein [Phycisphaerales bacterium]|nr:helix-turn-helix domain-containing protein [Phycisphaerales bacterium]